MQELDTGWESRYLHSASLYKVQLPLHLPITVYCGSHSEECNSPHTLLGMWAPNAPNKMLSHSHQTMSIMLLNLCTESVLWSGHLFEFQGFFDQLVIRAINMCQIKLLSYDYDASFRYTYLDTFRSRGLTFPLQTLDHVTKFLSPQRKHVYLKINTKQKFT